MLWTAPEHLREVVPSVSVKGDVYSFGIVLHEILTKSAPFSDLTLQPEGSILSCALIDCYIDLSR